VLSSWRQRERERSTQLPTRPVQGCSLSCDAAVYNTPTPTPSESSVHSQRPLNTRCHLSQAERWGAELHMEDVEFVDTSVRPFVIRTSEREVRSHPHQPRSDPAQPQPHEFRVPSPRCYPHVAEECHVCRVWTPYA
jgi:hypothetical protein